MTHRNGSRTRLLSTKAGDVELHIPKLREGSFFPALLEPRRRIDRALWAVVMEAYVHGVSTRKVDDLVAALGIEAGISKSEVSRICGELDGVVGAFRSRRLDHVAFPYLFLDATYVKAHDGPSVVSKAIVVATGVTAGGEREVLGLDSGTPRTAPSGRASCAPCGPGACRGGACGPRPGSRAPAWRSPRRAGPASSGALTWRASSPARGYRPPRWRDPVQDPRRVRRAAPPYRGTMALLDAGTDSQCLAGAYLLASTMPPGRGGWPPR